MTLRKGAAMENNKFKFRASYSVLRLWEESRWEEAIKLYFHMDRWTSEAQADGKKFHEDWAEEIRRTNCKPAIFGGKKLVKPIVEKKIIVNIHDWLDLSFVMDLYDEGVLTDWKTGVTNSQDYVRMPQIPVYAVGCLLADMPIKKAEIYAFNQHATFEPVSYSFRNITDKVIAEGFEYIETFATEMHNYFLEHNLYVELGNGGADGKGDK